MTKLTILPVLFFNLLPLGQVFVLGGGLEDEAILLVGCSLLLIGITIFKKIEVNRNHLPIGLLIVISLLVLDTVTATAGGAELPYLSLVLIAINVSLAAYIFKKPFPLGKVAEILLTAMCLLYLSEFALRLVLGELIYSFPGGTPLVHVDRIATKIDERAIQIGTYILSPAYLNLQSLPFLPGDYVAAGLSGEPHLSCLSLLSLYLLSDNKTRFAKMNKITCVLALYFFSSVSVLIGAFLYGVYWVIARPSNSLATIIKVMAAIFAPLALVFALDAIYGILDEKTASRSMLDIVLGYNALLEGFTSLNLGGSIFDLPNFYNGFYAPQLFFAVPILFAALLVWIGRSVFSLLQTMDELEQLFLVVILAVVFKGPNLVFLFPIVVFTIEYRNSLQQKQAKRTLRPGAKRYSPLASARA